MAGRAGRYGSRRAVPDELIRYVEETGSTNADIAARLSAGEFVPEGEWLVARRQREGKGRQGREWFDSDGNFMGSTVVHRRFADPDPATLSLVAGMALYEAVAWHLPDASRLKLKWPNDLMLGTAKLAGILLEGKGDSIVVGIGVNLVAAPDLPDRETAAVADVAAAPSREVFAEDLAKAFDQELERWRSVGVAPLVRRWQVVAHPIGTEMTVTEPGGTELSGRFAGIGENGALRLDLADGTMRVIHAGDVFLTKSGE